MEYAEAPVLAAQAEVDERAAFLTRTYVHLVSAVLAFAGFEAILLQTAVAPWMLRFIGAGRFNWLLVLGAFMLVGKIAERGAQHATSVATQYAGLALYVIAESFLFLPLLLIAAYYSSPDAIPTAGLLTALIFVGLTGIVYTTRKDFSFLRGILGVVALAALGLIVASAIFGFNLGVLFSVVMVGVAGGYVLYYTSNVMLHYRTDQHVAASLALFAAIALLFWYILQILISRRR